MQDWIGKKRRSDKLFEDELTSCVFGPLRYMEPDKAWEACLLLFGLSDCAWYSDAKPDRVCVRFWPHFPRTDGAGRHVEPDAHIVAWDGNTLFRTILVETKWNSELQQCQLLNQWLFITAGNNNGAAIRDLSAHVLLSKKPLQNIGSIEEQERAAREKGIAWDNRLIVLSWYQVARRLVEVRGRDGPIEVWRRDLIAFLARHGIATFDGFRSGQFEPVNLVQWCFEAYTAPDLLEVGLLNRSFDRGNAV